MQEFNWEKVYQENYRSVYWTCLSFMKNADDAEDITQNVFISAFESWETIKDENKISAWLKSVAAHKCLNAIKARRTDSLDERMEDEEFGEFNEPVDENFLPDEYAINDEKRKIVMDIVRKTLSDDLYQTVIMFYFDDMNISEIASAMGVPEGTIKSRLNHSRKKIKEGVERFEKKNDKIFIAVPFLSLLLRNQALTEVPSIPVISASLTELMTASKTKLAAKSAKEVAKVAGKQGAKVLGKKAIIATVACITLGTASVETVKIIRNSRSQDENAAIMTEPREHSNPKLPDGISPSTNTTHKTKQETTQNTKLEESTASSLEEKSDAELSPLLNSLERDGKNADFISANGWNTSGCYSLKENGDIYQVGDVNYEIIANIPEAVELFGKADAGLIIRMKDGRTGYLPVPNIGPEELLTEDDIIYFDCPDDLVNIDSDMRVIFRDNGKLRYFSLDDPEVIQDVRFFFEDWGVYECKYTEVYPVDVAFGIPTRVLLESGGIYSAYFQETREKDNSLPDGWVISTGNSYEENDTPTNSISEPILSVFTSYSSPIIFTSSGVYYNNIYDFVSKDKITLDFVPFPDGLTYQDIDEIYSDDSSSLHVLMRTKDNRYYALNFSTEYFGPVEALTRYADQIVEVNQDTVLLEDGRIYTYYID